MSDAAVSSHQPPARTPPLQPLSSSSSQVTSPPHSSYVNPQSDFPWPLFPPTTLLVGDSIIRNVRFFNATTHGFPGATVHVMLDEIPGLLRSLPSSIERVIVHVGSNDTSCQQSELTKMDFNNLPKLFLACGKSFFISGPVPTLFRGVGRFSRILSLNVWLQSACRTDNVGFIENLNLFWNHSENFKSDGIHPNRLGSSRLTDNILHVVQNTPCD